MTENWLMVIVGTILVITGIGATAVSGAMPGAKPLGPPPLRLRVLLILFGALMVILGVLRLASG